MFGFGSKSFRRGFGRRFARSGIRSALLFGILATCSWVVGAPLLWPSLGPTTYLLAFDRDKNHPFKNVFGAHTIGAVSGVLAHQVFASSLTLKTIQQPLADASLHVALSSIIALSLTVGIMRGTQWMHSPACATTLITALGLISAFPGVIYLLAAVGVLYLTHLFTERLFQAIGWIDR